MWTDIHTLAITNPLRRSIAYIKKFTRYYCSLFYQIANTQKNIKIEKLETIDLFILGL
jgi:hypothetical protein